MTDFINNLSAKITSSYEEGVTLDAAEKLAGELLHAQLEVSESLKVADLDARMRRSGLKAVKAAVYMETCAKSDKKPTESALEHMINVSTVVSIEQDAFDKAEAERDNLERIFGVFREAHVHYRQLSKGRFE